MLLDLRRTQKTLPDQIFVFHDGISTKSRQLLSTILPVTFLRYRFPLKSLRVRFSPSVRHFTPLVFASFECLRLLEEFETVVQLDYDQVVLRDLAELSSSSFAIRACKNNAAARVLFREEIPGYNLDSPGFVTLAFGPAIQNPQELYAFCVSALKKYADQLYMPEMAIFALMVEKFGLKVDWVPFSEYSPHPRDADHRAKILHAYGQPKFWNGLANEQWAANYLEWIEMGGRPYRPGRNRDRFRRLISLISS